MILLTSNRICLSVLVLALHVTIYTINGQIVLDGTMGPTQSLQGPDFEIADDLGTTIGSNLFHSFSDFNVNVGETATFSGPDTISNVFSRVTGGNPSNIDGLLRSTIPGADMIFINPSGVLFGPNAQLDVAGSFTVSTADYIQLGDGGRFDATRLDATVLTAAPPEAFGFLTPNPGNLSIEGSTLVVQLDQSLSIISGDVQMTGTRIKGDSGNVSIVSVGSPGEVEIDVTSTESIFAVDSFAQLGDITLSDGVDINVDGEGGGGVKLHGRNVTMTDATISATTMGDLDGRDIEVVVDENLHILEGSTISTFTIGKGQGGSILLTARSLSINRMGSDSSTGLFTRAQAGSVSDLSLTLDITHTFDEDLTVTLISPLDTEILLFSSVGSDGDNFTNTVLDDEADLSIFDGSPPFSGDFQPEESLSTFDGENTNGVWTLSVEDTFPDEDDGVLHSWSLELNLTQFQSTDVPKPINEANPHVFSNIPVQLGEASGDGGDIRIQTESFELIGGDVSSLSSGSGRSGDISINASGTIDIIEESSVQTQSFLSNSGDIDIQAGGFLNLNQSEITTQATGNGGNIQLTSQDILQRFSTLIDTDVGGEGGTIDIDPVPTGSIVLDGSFGVGGALVGPDFIVSEEMGLVSGRNLFHSFGDFSLAVDETLTFTSINAIDNILARITGDNPSLIDGTIGTTIPDVNLYFINPSGMLFGSGAQLDIGGSIVITTGDYIKLGDSGRFDVSEPDNSILTSGLPNTFGFLRTDPENISFVKSDLILNEDKTLSIIGGDITIEGAQIMVPGGDVTILSVASEGEMSIDNTDKETPIDITSFSDLGALDILNGGWIAADTFGISDDGSITINAGSVRIDRQDSGNFTGITVDNTRDASGSGGTINLNAVNLDILNGGWIAADTFGIGDGGSITIDAESIRIDMQDSSFFTGITVDTTSNASGNGGTINLNAVNLDILNGGEIGASSFGSGDGGTIIIDVKSVYLDSQNSGEPTDIVAQTFSENNGGRGGDISVDAQEVVIVNGGRIGVGTLGKWRCWKY